MNTDLLNITESEFRAIGAQDPALMTKLVQRVFILRSPAAEGGFQDSWKPYLSVKESLVIRPPTPYMVERILPIPCLAKIYGPPGTLKSMLLMDLGVCVGMGRPWLQGGDLPPFKTVKSPVLWLDLDQGEAIMLQRLGALSRGLGASGENCSFLFKSLPAEGFDLTRMAQVGDMSLRIKDLGAQMVCIDNLGVAKGNADENSDQMIPVMYNLRMLADTTKTVIVLLHHARKENGYKARYGEGSRGHTSITAAVDISLGTERKDLDPDVTITVGKVRRKPIDPFGALFHYESFADSDDMYKAWFSGLTQTEAQSKEIAKEQARRDAIDEAILKALVGGSLNQQKLIQKVKELAPKAPIPQIRTRLEALAEDGQLVIDRGAKNACFYTLP
jgi:hypothetical protein